MRFFDWLGNLFTKNNGSQAAHDNSVTVNVSDYRASPDHIAIDAFATLTVVQMIANLIGKCEFKTYQSGREVKGMNWYALNVRPNVNQNSTEFWQEYVSRMLVFGDALIVQNGKQYIIADNFSFADEAIRQIRFENVSRAGVSLGTHYIEDVIYSKYSAFNCNYPSASMSGMYEELLRSAKKKYIQSGGQKGTLEIPALAQSERDFEKRYTQLMNEHFKNFFNAQNAVLPLWNGVKYVSASTAGTQKQTNEISDISRLVDDALARKAQQYKVPVSLVRGDVAGVNDAVNMMLTTCIDPLADILSEEITAKIYGTEVLKGNFAKVDTSCIKHIDIFEIATNADKLISCGMLSPDEVRIKAGETPTGEEWAKKHYVTKNYEMAENTLKGGEENG